MSLSFAKSALEMPVDVSLRTSLNILGQEAGQWKIKRPNQPMPLSHNFVAGDTYFPGGERHYRLPPVPKPYCPQNYDGVQNPTWVASNFGYDPNVILF